MAATSYMFKRTFTPDRCLPPGVRTFELYPADLYICQRTNGANSRHRISGQAPVVCDKKVHRSYRGASQLNCIRRSESPVLRTELCKRICRRLVECDHLQLRKACQIAISQVFTVLPQGMNQ